MGFLKHILLYFGFQRIIFMNLLSEGSMGPPEVSMLQVMSIGGMLVAPCAGGAPSP